MGGTLAFLGFLLVIAVVYKILVYFRTKQANLNTGCVACGSNNLQPTGQGKILCRSCGYEGSADKGGVLSERDVGDFTNRG